MNQDEKNLEAAGLLLQWDAQQDQDMAAAWSAMETEAEAEARMSTAQPGYRWPEDAAALAEHIQDAWIDVRGQPNDGLLLGCKWCKAEATGAPRHFPHEEHCIVVIANKIAREYYEDFNAEQKRQGKAVYSEPRS